MFVVDSTFNVSNYFPIKATYIKKVCPVERAGVNVSEVTASMDIGLTQICPGFSVLRLVKLSQSPVPLGASRLYHWVQHTARNNKREICWRETAEPKHHSK